MSDSLVVWSQHPILKDINFSVLKNSAEYVKDFLTYSNKSDEEKWKASFEFERKVLSSIKLTKNFQGSDYCVRIGKLKKSWPPSSAGKIVHFSSNGTISMSLEDVDFMKSSLNEALIIYDLLKV